MLHFNLLSSDKERFNLGVFLVIMIFWLYSKPAFAWESHNGYGGGEYHGQYNISLPRLRGPLQPHERLETNQLRIKHVLFYNTGSPMTLSLNLHVFKGGRTTTYSNSNLLGIQAQYIDSVSGKYCGFRLFTKSNFATLNIEGEDVSIVLDDAFLQSLYLAVGLRGEWEKWKGTPTVQVTPPIQVIPPIQVTPPVQVIPPVYTLNAHDGKVRNVAVTPNGRYIVSNGGYGRDKKIKIWNLQNGSLVNTLDDNLFDDAWSILVNPNGENIIKIWQLSGSAVVGGHTSPVSTVALTSDNQYLVSGSYDRTIRIWRLSDNSLSRTLIGHTATISDLVITPDDNFIISGSQDSTIKIWEINSGSLVQTLIGHRGHILSLAITPDGQYLVSGSSDKTIRIWRLENGVTTGILTGHSGIIFGLAISPDGRYLLSGSNDKTVKLWSMPDGSLLETVGEHREAVKSVAITPDGRYAISGSFDGEIKVWQIP